MSWFGRRANVHNDSDRLVMASQSDRPRVALVIGISNYAVSKLPNAVKDAMDMAHMLEDKAGFHVTSLLDPTRWATASSTAGAAQHSRAYRHHTSTCKLNEAHTAQVKTVCLGLCICAPAHELHIFHHELHTAVAGVPSCCSQRIRTVCLPGHVYGPF